MASERLKVTTENLLTVLQLPDNADKRLELIDGELVEKMPTQAHALIVAYLLIEIGLYLRGNPMGRIMPEVRYQLPDQTSNARIPDLSFVSNDRGPIVTRGATPYLPDLAIEVQSPDQTQELLEKKAVYYLAHGTKLVWIVLTDSRQIITRTASERGILRDGDRVEGGSVLPGLSIGVTAVFDAADGR